jgi:hypothetical protein
MARRLICVVCGCSQHRACRPECAWIAKGARPLCSGCLRFLMNVRDPERLAAILKACGITVDNAAALDLVSIAAEFDVGDN